MTSTHGIRVAVIGEWVPPQLAHVLTLQRAEEPETPATLSGWTESGSGRETPGDRFDFALSTVVCTWPGWVCEPLWHDTLAVAAARRSHLLAYREVPCQELLKQPLLRPRSIAEEPWRAVTQQIFENTLQAHEETVDTFDVAMTLVGAGYGIALAPAARLADYQHRGIVERPLANTPAIVIAYLLRPQASLTTTQARFAERAHQAP